MRTLEASQFGKLTQQLPKLRISDKTMEHLQQMATASGMSVSELHRLLVECSVHGSEQQVAVGAAVRVLSVAKRCAYGAASLLPALDVRVS